MNIAINQITPQQLVSQLYKDSSNIVLLDVREPNEVAICALNQSIHIPMHLIPVYLDIIPDNKQIIIYCHHGIRSLNVALYLIGTGFEHDNIYSLQGGIDAWALEVDQSMNRY